MTLLIMQFCHLTLRETSLSLASFDQLAFLSVPRRTTSSMRNRYLSQAVLCHVWGRPFCYVVGI